jgi:hypothetical protein
MEEGGEMTLLIGLAQGDKTSRAGWPWNLSSLQQLGWALRMRWLWQKTEPEKPWAFSPSTFIPQSQHFS